MSDQFLQSETVENAIEIANISKMYKMYDSPRARLKEALNPFGKKYHKEFWALKGIDLNVKKGEVLGILGRNGSGKSTLLKIIAGIIQPTTGEVKVNGKVAALLEVGSGMNNSLTGRENIQFLGNIIGNTHEEMVAQEAEIIDFAEIGAHIDQPVRTYSSGMRAKLGFAIATSVTPEILILDEVLSVGDDLFKRKAFARIEKLINDGNITVLFVSHNLQSVKEICQRAIVLNAGRYICSDLPDPAIRAYMQILYRNSDTSYKAAAKATNDLDSITENSLSIQKYADGSGDYYISQFESKSINIVIRSELEIGEISLLKEDIKVNHISEGHYTFNYTLKTPVEKEVYIAYTIRNIQGVVITGYDSRQAGVSTILFSNQEVAVGIEFDCRLTRGIYFLHMSIWEKGSNELLLGVADACAFQVVQSTSYIGYAKMHVNIRSETV